MLPTFTTALPDRCTPTTAFLVRISSYFHTCIPTTLAFLSITLGTCSIISWLFAQLPQVWKNYQRKGTGGLTLGFLVLWCVGDTMNLIGATLTQQATWQIILEIYYVTVDVLLLLQYLWYRHGRVGWRKVNVVRDTLNQGDDPQSMDALLERATADESQTEEELAMIRSGDEGFQIDGDENTMSVNHKPSSTVSPINNKHRQPRHRVPASTLIPALMIASNISRASAYLSQPHTTSITPTQTRTAITIGRIFSWPAHIFFIASRLPLIRTNHQRRSVSGLSPLLFLGAFLGNLFYCAGMLANPCAWSDLPPYGGGGWVRGGEGSRRAEWVGLAAPFWLGSFGVMALDGVVGWQFWVFGAGERV